MEEIIFKTQLFDIPESTAELLAKLATLTDFRN
jgi:hypothetical protein